MPHETSTEQEVLRDLGDGLVMRRATLQDRERVADFHANTLLDIGETGPDMPLRLWMLDLLSGEHPTIKPGDFVFVEDANTGKVVSSMGLLSQEWTYEGVPFKFGQPEIVSTDPAYRRRGLVRAQFEEVHRWSAERGELVQGVTGIPWYYRQFGYEMAINLEGSRQAFRPLVPKLKGGEAEPYSARRATVEDVPFFMEMYRQETSRSLIASIRDEAIWRYDIEGRTPLSGFSVEVRVIETPQGEPVGALLHSSRARNGNLNTYMYEVRHGVSFLAVTPSVMRYLEKTGEEYTRRDAASGDSPAGSKSNESAVFETITFRLGEQHPVYDTVAKRLPRVTNPYAWYIRVPDLPGFVRHIAPALEKRLAESAQAGYLGEIKITFYRSGLLLRFREGSITVEAWKPDRVEEGDAAFPDLTFIQLLFGYRSIEELQHAFPDCEARNDEARALLPILFPKKNSNVWAGG